MKHQLTARSKADAQSLVEFALILPILLLLIFGIIDFGWITFNYAQLYNAFREGVRFGSVNGGTPPQYKDCPSIRTHVVSNAGFSGIKDTDVTIYYDDGRPISGSVASNPPEMVGTCPVGGTNTFVANPNYVAKDGTTRSSLQEADRIVISIDTHIYFLTPFMQAFASAGFPVHVSAARSIFPTGISS